MKVILLQDVPKIGKKDQVLEAKEGYARNYLFPKKLAVEATPANMKELQRQEKIRAEKAAELKAEAVALGEKLKNTTVTIQTKCGAGGKLFGAVTNKEIAEQLEYQHDEQERNGKTNNHLMVIGRCGEIVFEGVQVKAQSAKKPIDGSVHQVERQPKQIAYYVG